MENPEISIVEALNHIQSWLNAGEYDRVIRGTQEILELEPGNQRALSLMKQAEEKRHQPVIDPLAELQVHTPDAPERSEGEIKKNSDGDTEKRKLFLAMLLPAIIVVLIGGSTIWWLANRQREETIVNSVTSNLPVDRSYLDENEKRLEELTNLSLALERYKVIHGAYPSVSQLESALEDSGDFEEVPSDPRQGEIDKAGKPFGYIYAVYEGIAGENSVYILSALFEDSKGFGYAWAKGAPIKNYPDYRKFEESNITFVGAPERAVGPSTNDTEVELQEEPSGPQVNPDNKK